MASRGSAIDGGMARTVPYDASREALFCPGEAEDHFAGWTSEGEAALCAEMSRLAYVRDRGKVERSLGRVGFSLAAAPFDRDGTSGLLATRDDLAVVAFRGTEPDDLRDLIANALALALPWQGPGRVHRGFARALEPVQEQVEAALSRVSGRIVFTGHSLGAAVATLLAALHPPAHLYTIGSPRVGDAEFVAALGEKVAVSCFVDCCDLVCWLPARPYRHLGRLFYIDREGGVRDAPAATLVRRDRGRGRWEYLQTYSWRRGTPFLRDLADHAPINYVAALRSGAPAGEPS